MAINKVEANGQTLIDLTNDTATANDVIEGKTLHLASGAVATGTYRPSDEIEARLRATVGHSSKNLLEITAHATTKLNVTFTPDRINGTILATGQCNSPTTNQAQYDYAGGLKPIPDSFRQELILKDDGLIEGTQSAIAFYDDSGTYISGVTCDKTTKSKTVTIPSNATKYKAFVRKLASAGDVDVTFKPMLREASISDGSFEPYQEPTDSLIETKARAYLTSTVGHSSKNLLDMTKYATHTGVSNIQINEDTGSLSFTGTGSKRSVFYLVNDNLGLKPNDTTYILTFINNLANSSSGRLTIRRRDTNDIKYSAYLSTTGKKELKFTASSETFPNGWYISIMATGSTSTTGNIGISNLMLREASISDDAFEPYQEPTDERIVDLEARVAALEAIINNR